MDFDFTQEQVMLRNLTREFLTRESTPRAVRTLMEEPNGFSDATWQQMSEMGLPGLAIDPGYGGQDPAQDGAGGDRSERSFRPGAALLGGPGGALHQHQCR